MVNLSGHVDPEFGFLHYCVILKTHDKDLFFALPTTSKRKEDKFMSIIPEDGSICLFKHARPISRIRILKPLLDNKGNQIIMSNDNLKILINNYKYFIDAISKKSLWSNKDFLSNNIENKTIIC